MMSTKTKWEIRRIEKDRRAEKLHKDQRKLKTDPDQEEDEFALLDRLFPMKSTMIH